MRENAYSIFDNHQEQEGDSNYNQWLPEQLPCVLLGIGDALSATGRHAYDAADAYSRVLEKRQRALVIFQKPAGPIEELSQPPILLAHQQGHKHVLTAETNTGHSLSKPTNEWNAPVGIMTRCEMPCKRLSTIW